MESDDVSRSLGPDDLDRLQVHRAQKMYRCSKCDGTIHEGQPYSRYFPAQYGQSSGEIKPFRLCYGCRPVTMVPLVRPIIDVSQLELPFGAGAAGTFVMKTALIRTGETVDEGQLVVGVAIPWFEIARAVAADREFLFQVPWRRMEELIAGAYEREGWDVVVLTPRSGDHGRDIIAERRDIGIIRIIDQVKAYGPGHRVTANDVRSVLGVLTAYPNTSKGIVTTSATFAPGIANDHELQQFMPFRLELKDGAQLQEWLRRIATDCD